MDAGWQIRLDEYANQLTFPILHTLTAALAKAIPNPAPAPTTPRFSFAEVVYLAAFLEREPTALPTLQQAARQGLLEFVSGGWVQADELVASLDGRLASLETGHAFLVSHGLCQPHNSTRSLLPLPDTAWKIDPFGSSLLSLALLPRTGFTNLVQARIPHELKDALYASGHGEILWQASPSTGAAAPLPTHILQSYAYVSELGFDFDQFRTHSPPVTPENVAARAAALVALARTWANQTAASLNTTPATRSPPLPVLLPWGGDFRWQNASFWYGNMTTVIAYINSHPDTLGASCSFATAREYFAARDAYLAKQGHTPASALPPLRDTPFAPYDGRNEADAGGAAWTGIYSSRANLKQQLRRLERLLRASDLLAALAALHRPRAALPPGTLSALTTARQTVALLQHHDAVPGTANSARYTGSDPIHGGLVVQDYADRLAASLSQLQPLSAALASLLAGGEADSAEATWEPVLDAHTNTRPLLPARRNSAVLVFNPTPRNLTTTVLVPAEQLGGVSVRLRGSSSPVPHQWLPPSVPTSPTSPLSPTPSPPSPPQLAILATLPPWGSAVYDVSLSSTPSTPPTPPSDRRSSPPRLQGACLDVLLNATDGSLARLAARLDNGTVVELALAAAPHVYTNTSSGAYAFHPTAAARPVPETPHWQVTADGPLLTLVTRSYPEHGLNSTLTLHKHAEDALCGTLELAVGTAPLANMTELIWRLQTDLRSDGVLWADNGLAATSSRRNTSRPIEYNYWPAVRGAALADGNTNVGGGSSRRRLEVLLPHTHGVASLADGQLEVMIQRNVWSLDGEGPAGNDTKSMLARLVLLPGLAESSSSENHTKGLDVHAAVGDPPLVFVQTSIPTGPSNSSASAVSGFAGLRRALPAGLRWQAMRLVSNISSEGSITVLLRFVNEREDEEVAVDVAAVLPAGVRVVQLVETLASGQQPINNNNTAASAASSANTLVTLPPKAFRTFHAVLEAATTASIASTQPQRPEPLRQPF